MMDSLTIRLVRLPLLVPFATNYGVEEERRALILDYISDDIRACSECATFENPGYSAEDNETALHFIRDRVVPAIKSGGQSPAEFLACVARIRGHNMAKASIEMLLWDLKSKQKNKSLVQELGVSKGRAEVGISLGLESPDVIVRRVEEALQEGYKRIKIKVKRGEEYKIIERVRDRFPDAPLSVDANGAYTLKDAEALRRLDRFELLYLEQPLGQEDIMDHARLAKRITTPLCLDESISTVSTATRAFELGAATIINIKPGRLGGLTNSLDVAKVARNFGGHSWVGGMLEMGVGRAFNMALAALELVDLPGDTSPNQRYFSQDIVKNTFKMVERQHNSKPGVWDRHRN